MPRGRKIIIEAVDADEQRYPTVGDWLYNGDGDLIIRVTAPDPLSDHEGFLIALHELVEAKLCLTRGIEPSAVDAFDKAFTGSGEPGDDPQAPYRQEHRQAMLAEHLVANFLGLTGYGRVE